MLAKRMRYWQITATGMVMVSLGFIIPFLMCIQVMAPSFALCFLSYSVSVAGVLLGIVGVSEESEIG